MEITHADIRRLCFIEVFIDTPFSKTFLSEFQITKTNRKSKTNTNSKKETPNRFFTNKL